MTVLDPAAIALKFGFLAVLYLFLLWVARSALQDLRASAAAPEVAEGPLDPGTGVYEASSGLAAGRRSGRPVLRVETAPGLRSGAAYDLSDGAVLGRGEDADIRLEDTFASSRHARLSPHGDVLVVEDLGSTNGTFLNGEPLRGPQPLHAGDKIRIGDSEFSYDQAM